MANAMGKFYHEWAKTPPMGRNSLDIFGVTVTEKQAKKQADDTVRGCVGQHRFVKQKKGKS